MIARCTCPIDAAATGIGSQLANIRSGRLRALSHDLRGQLGRHRRRICCSCASALEPVRAALDRGSWPSARASSARPSCGRARRRPRPLSAVDTRCRARHVVRERQRHRRAVCAMWRAPERAPIAARRVFRPRPMRSRTVGAAGPRRRRAPPRRRSRRSRGVFSPVARLIIADGRRCCLGPDVANHHNGQVHRGLACVAHNCRCRRVGLVPASPARSATAEPRRSFAGAMPRHAHTRSHARRDSCCRGDHCLGSVPPNTSAEESSNT